MTKRVVFFHPSADLYGADRILAQVLGYFAPQIERIVVIPNDGPLVELLNEVEGIRVIIERNMPIIAMKYMTPIGILHFLHRFISFKLFLNKIIEKDTVVYFNTLAVIPISLLVPRGIKRITHVHEILPNASLSNRLINKVTVKKSTFVICVSEAVKRNLAAVVSSSLTERLEVVRNGICFTTSEYQIQTEFSSDSSLTNVALIGRIKPSRKGQMLLLEALSHLPQNVLNSAHFYLVGSTVKGQEYMLEDIKKYVKHHNLESYVSIVPFIKDVSLVYQNIDISAIPSTFDDPFPTTVLEAMAWKKPVIATKVGGIPEMVDDGETGFLSNRNDAQDLARKLETLIRDKALQTDMGQKGYDKYKRLFTSEAFKERYTAVIRKHIN